MVALNVLVLTLTAWICAFHVKYVLVQPSEYYCGTELECLQAVATTAQQQMQLMSEQLRLLRSQNTELLDAYRAQTSSQTEVLKMQLELLRGMKSAATSNNTILRSILEYFASSCAILVLVPVAQWLFGKIVSAYRRWQFNRVVRLWTRCQAEHLRTTLPHTSQSTYGSASSASHVETLSPQDIPLEHVASPSDCKCVDDPESLSPPPPFGLERIASSKCVDICNE